MMNDEEIRKDMNSYEWAAQLHNVIEKRLN